MIFYIKLLALLIFALVISWKDWKHGKIYNKDLVLMLLAGLALSLFDIDLRLLPMFFSNIALSVLAGFFFWKINFWSAGDGKLFALCSLFLPAGVFKSFFPSQMIFINIFLIAFFLYFPLLIIKTKMKEKKEVLKKALEPKIILNMMLAVFGLFWVLGKATAFFNVSGHVIPIALAFAFFYIMQKKLPQKSIIVLSALTVARILLDSTVFSLEFLKTFVFLLFGFLVINSISLLSVFISYETRYLNDLKEGDVPMGLMRKKESKKDINFTELLKSAFGIDSERIMSKGFEKGEIEKAGKLKDEIDGFVVKKRIVFAPMLFIATFLTILIDKDLFLFMFSILYRWFFE